MSNVQMLQYANKIRDNKAAVIAGVNSMANVLDCEPDWLSITFQFESGWNPGASNGLGYFGLIQFGAEARQLVGVTVSQLISQNTLQQLPYVEKYYTKIGAKGKIDSLVDLYLYTFYPVAARKPDSYVIATAGQSRYKNNPKFQKDGKITVGSVADVIESYDLSKKQAAIGIGTVAGAALGLYVLNNLK